MFRSNNYRAKAAEYVELGRKTALPNEIREFGILERSFTSLADNEDWMERNAGHMVDLEDNDAAYGEVLVRKTSQVVRDGRAAEEQLVLRCLGSAIAAQWNSIPQKLQRELFDKAAATGDVLKTEALRGQIARFLHKHTADAS